MKKNQLISVVDLGKNVLPHDISESEFLIGRSKECHVVLDDKKISREHAKITHLNSIWKIHKISEDGVCLINGDEFQVKELEVGDVITINSFSVEIIELKVERTSVHSQVSNTNNTQISEVVNVPSAIDNTESHEALLGENNLLDATGEINNPVEELDSFVEENQVENIQGESGYNDNFDSESIDTSEEVFTVDSVEEVPLEDYEQYDENLPYAQDNSPSEFDEGTRILNSFISVHLELLGEHAPYDKFTVDKDEIYIGRDPDKCHIILPDGEVSSVHAVIKRINTVLTLEDLNSSNGTLHNGDRINKVELHHNDEFVIGSVAFTVKFRSEFLKEENATLMPVDEHQMIEVEEVVEVQVEDDEEIELDNSNQEATQEKSIIKRILKDEASRKKALYGLVVLVLAWLMFEDEKPKELPKAPPKKTSTEVKSEEVKRVSKVKLTPEQEKDFSQRFQLGREHYNNGRYREALTEFQIIANVDPDFHESLQSMIVLSKDGLSKLEEIEKERIAKIQAQERKIKVEKLLEEARTYTKERRVDMAFSVFNEIVQLDPENVEISRLKMELEDWQNQERRKALEEAQKKKDRENKVSLLQPGKTLYLQKEWFKAIGKLQEFLDIKEMDEDLVIEAAEMLKTSKNNLEEEVAPLVGKARSLKEGQDLKGAYNVYQLILKIDPSHGESMDEMASIRDTLTSKARKIYRDAIISESLSLFQDAKEKFQEVQQISPVDSEYYKKATDKLKYYLD